MSSDHLNKVKARLCAIKNQIDDAEDREQQAREKLQDAIAQEDKADSDVQSYQRRIQLVREELQRTQETLVEKERRLDHMLQRKEDEEMACKELEGVDQETDEKLVELEDAVMDGLKIAAEEEHKLVECNQKFRVTEDELLKATTRGERFEERVEYLENSINQTGESLLATDERYGAVTEREIEAEEKIEFLQQQLKELVTRYEEEERKVQPIERVIDGIMEDMARYKGKSQEIRDEMDAMGDMVDDIAGFDDVQKPASAMEKFQELQKQSDEPEPEPEPKPEAEPEPEPEPEDEDEE